MSNLSTFSFFFLSFLFFLLFVFVFFFFALFDGCVLQNAIKTKISLIECSTLQRHVTPIAYVLFQIIIVICYRKERPMILFLLVVPSPSIALLLKGNTTDRMIGWDRK